jgi:hypothetical protein
MTHLVGPVYIAHPYWAPTAEGRSRNVGRGALLSNAVNRLGAATISPLQESHGRESALTEDLWHEHGLVPLRVSKAIVLPRDYHTSSGCVGEFCLARRLGIQDFHAEWASDLNKWILGEDFAEWVKHERECLEAQQAYSRSAVGLFTDRWLP